MNCILKKQLERRTFLRGMGTVLALPMLDAMVPAFVKAASVGSPIAHGDPLFPERRPGNHLEHPAHVGVQRASGRPAADARAAHEVPQRHHGGEWASRTTEAARSAMGLAITAAPAPPI
jgi:hypothetical protein